MKKILILASAAVVLAFVKAGVSAPEKTETYSLVHAIGNSERVSAWGLSHQECELRKVYLKRAADALFGGSVTCIPDNLVGGAS